MGMGFAGWGTGWAWVTHWLPMTSTSDFHLLNLPTTTESMLWLKPPHGPFMLDVGQNLWLAFEPIWKAQLESLDNFATRSRQLTRQELHWLRLLQVAQATQVLWKSKARSLEVWRFPGIGFSLCAVPTFSHIQGISNGGYKLSFQNAPEWRKCTGTIPTMSVKARETEVQSRRVWRYVECAECARIEWVLLWRVEFDIQNAETYIHDTGNLNTWWD